MTSSKPAATKFDSAFSSNCYWYRIENTIQTLITRRFSARLHARIVFMPHVRIDGGRRQTAHIWYASAPIATVKKSGCRRWSQKRQPALIRETNPSPARTCGNTHQLGVNRAATILSMPARLGSPGNVIPPFAANYTTPIPAGQPHRNPCLNDEASFFIHEVRSLRHQA